jgi:hypothetical protein
MQVLLDNKLNFYKASLHGHSTYSDGNFTVEELKELFKKQGYSVVAFTDHEHLIDNSNLDDSEFLTITSAELAIKEFPTQSTLVNYNMRVTHLNIYALDQHNVITPCYNSVYDHYVKDNNKDKIFFEKEYERVYSPDGINEIIKIANEKGFLVQYNHPTWSLENATDYVNFKGLWAIEVYNNSVNFSGGDSYVPNAFDDLLRKGNKIYATMCDDNHHLDSMFGGYVMINADKLDYSTIMTALKNGNFYSSQGPEIISLVKDGNKVKIKTSGAKQIAMTTYGRKTKAFNAKNGEPITEAEFELIPSYEYFRITVTDFEGKHALTQAYKV